MEQKKLLIVAIPAIILFVGYILYDELVEKDSNAPEQGEIIFADENFVENKSVAVNTLSNESKVVLLEKKYDREQKEAILNRKVVDEEDFFGNGFAENENQPVDESFTSGDLREPPKETEKHVKSTPFRTGQTNRQPFTKQEVNEQVAPPASASTRSRERNAMFNSGVTAETASGSSTIGIQAVVHGDHQITSGQNILLRTTEATQVNGIEIPKNSFINATTKFSQDRVFISMDNVTLKDQIIPVKSTVYDAFDNSEGIYVPGGVEREIKNDLIGDIVTETSKNINVPMVGSIKVGTKKKVADPTVRISNGHKLIIKFIN